MTYQELAEKSGISVSTVQRYCTNGVKSPSVDVTDRLNKALEETTVETDVCGNATEGDYMREVVGMLKKQHEEEIADKDRQILRIRVEKYICAALAIAVTAVLIGLFLYDYSHPDRGWIRYENAEYTVANVMGIS